MMMSWVYLSNLGEREREALPAGVFGVVALDSSLASAITSRCLLLPPPPPFLEDLLPNLGSGGRR